MYKKNKNTLMTKDVVNGVGATEKLQKITGRGLYPPAIN